MTDRRIDDRSLTLLTPVTPPAQRTPAWPKCTQPIKLFEIDQQFCALEYGISPCNAVLGTTGPVKCYNTFATCQDRENYEPNGIALSSEGAGLGETTEPVFGTQGEFTWDFMCAPEGSGGPIAEWSTGLANNQGNVSFSVTAAGALLYRRRNSAGDFVIRTILPNGGIRFGDSYHILMIRQAFAVTVYVQGTFAARMAAPDALALWSGQFGGAKMRAPLMGYEGRVEHIRLWNRALSETERTEVVGKQIESTGSQDGLVHHWPVRRRDDNTPAADDIVGDADIDAITGDVEFVNGTLPEPLVLRFAWNMSGLADYDPVIPSMMDGSPRTAPMQLNLGGMADGASPFGRREEVDVSLVDHVSDDRRVDKYREERPFAPVIDTILQTEGGDPIQTEGEEDIQIEFVESGGVFTFNPRDLGTFWSKWIARNPFYNGYPARIREGYIGQALSEMATRSYVIDGFAGPDDNGVVSFKLIDLFSRAERRKAQCPRASRAVIDSIAGDMENSTTFTVEPTDADILMQDYPASGTFRVRVNSEIFRVTRSGATFTIVERGADNTEQADHSVDDSVQFVERFDAMSAQEIVLKLLTQYVGVSNVRIPFEQWQQQNLIFAYSASISEPTDVSDLIGELAVQAGFTIWPDVYTDQIRLLALEPSALPPEVISDDGWLIAGTYSTKREDEKRLSRVWIHYDQRDPTKRLDDTSNYRTTLVFADLQAEGEFEYGSPSIKEIYSRWVRVRAAATQTGARLLSMFRDPPFRTKFAIDICREGQLQYARPFRLSIPSQTDAIGLPLQERFVPVAIDNGDDQIGVVAQQYRFFAPPDEDRVINIDVDTLDFNAREQYDSAFVEPPQDGDVVRIVIAPGVVVGASSADTYAFRTGDWPSGVTLIVEQRTDAIVTGYAGRGGRGSTGSGLPALPGEDGGPAVLAEYAVEWDNEGRIQGGGGGGGGGGMHSAFVGISFISGAGGGGGGGAGRAGNTGGPSGFSFGQFGGTVTQPAEDGETSTPTNPGAGGEPGEATASSTTVTGGKGGDGGAPAQDGEDGEDGTTEPGAAGGQGGGAIDGDSFISFTEEGTILGARNG